VFGKIALVGALTLSTIFMATPAQAVTKYTTCTAVTKTFPYGIGIKAAKDKVGTGFSPVTNFKVVSSAVYNASAKLDSDKDKIICEVPKYKNCTYLNKKYPHGAGLKGAKDKSAKPVTNFTVISTAFYNTNKVALDRDKDNILCEKK